MLNKKRQYMYSLCYKLSVKQSGIIGTGGATLGRHDDSCYILQSDTRDYDVGSASFRTVLRRHRLKVCKRTIIHELLKH